MTHIVEATSSEDYEVAQRLFQAYAESLDFDLEFQHFTTEVAELPGCYSPPAGCILLAISEGRPVGCAALRPLDAGICEMKRLYTVPKMRGTGVGRLLADAIIQRARRVGCRRLRLDTVTGMRAANSLYASLGFYPIGAYCHNPLPAASFFELEL